MEATRISPTAGILRAALLGALLALWLPAAGFAADLAAPGDCAETSPDLVTPPVQAQPQGVPSSPAEHFSPVDVALDLIGTLHLDPSTGPAADLIGGGGPPGGGDRPSLDPSGNPVTDLTRHQPEPAPDPEPELPEILPLPPLPPITEVIGQ